MNANDVYVHNGNERMETRNYFDNIETSKNIMRRLEKKKNRVILFFTIFILSFSANGQVQIEPIKLLSISENSLSKQQIENIEVALQGKVAGFSEMPLPILDTIPLVEYVKAENFEKQPAFYINGKLSAYTILSTIDPMVIDSLYIEKNEIEIEGKRYYGQIYIKLKKEYTPNILSLNDLMLKYTNLKNEFTIFMLDDNIIKGDFDQYFVDEKYILKIILDTVEIEKGKTQVNLVRLLTKSKENIEKSGEIRIRGFNKIAMN